jgi:hypothetical protein
VTYVLGKAVQLQAWNGPERSRKLRLPDFLTTAHYGDKVVSLTHRPPLPPGNTPGTHFRWRLGRPKGHSEIGRIISKEKSSDTIWNRTSDLPIPNTTLTTVLPRPPTVAHYPNHCATAVPIMYVLNIIFIIGYYIT